MEMKINHGGTEITQKPLKKVKLRALRVSVVNDFRRSAAPAKNFRPASFRGPQRAPRRGGLVGVIVRVGPARSRSACPERSRGDLRFFLLISAWPSFPFHLPPNRNVYRRCHRWSRGSPYPAGTAPDQVLRFGLRLSPTQNPIYTLTTSIASPGGRFDSQRDLPFITVCS